MQAKHEHITKSPALHAQTINISPCNRGAARRGQAACTLTSSQAAGHAAEQGMPVQCVFRIVCTGRRTSMEFLHPPPSL